MKYTRVALVVFAACLAMARVRAQDDSEQRQPPVEIPDFSNLDEYIYEPRSTVTLSFRHLSGAKTSFFGGGTIPAPETLPSDITTPNLTRDYHDGSVLPDARTTPRLDSSGNPVIDPTTGVVQTDPIAPDGRTNSWTYQDPRQVGDGVPNGFVAFHSYSASVVDTTKHDANGRSTNGLDIAVSHDMGKLFGRITWMLMGGMSINDIRAKTSAKVQANVQTITDLYSLYGQAAPTAPYSAPTTTQQTVLDANGNPVTNADGSTQTISVDNSVLIGSQPAARETTTTTDLSSVVDNWELKGAYYTFRVGPQIMIPITKRFSATFSLGAALVYAGTTYTVVQTFTPAIGPDITTTDTDNAYKLRPGYYADASLQYSLTDKAGLFAGAVFQSAGSYTQALDSATAHYATKVDLSNQNGLRAGMAIRF